MIGTIVVIGLAWWLWKESKKDRRIVGEFDGKEYRYKDFDLRGTNPCIWYHTKKGCKVAECMSKEMVGKLNKMTKWDKSTTVQCDIQPKVLKSAKSPIKK